MKSNNMFRDQVNSVTSWFGSWSACEQTVALYSLLKQIPPLQCRFLVQMLQQRLNDNHEVVKQEEEANDPGFICKLSLEPKEKAVNQLLNHLPLLHSGNPKAKIEYLKLIPVILSHSIEHGVFIEESRQLLSYSLIHPAITSEERSNFNMWLGQLDERFSVYHHGQGQGQIQTDENRQGQGYNNQGDQGNMNSSTQVIVTGRANGLYSGYGQTDMQSNVNGREIHGGSQNNLYYTDRAPPAPTQQLLTTTSGHIPLHSTMSAPANFNTMVPNSSQSLNQSVSVNHHGKLRRMPSVTPPGTLPGCLPCHNNVSEWLDSNSVQHSEHAPLSPQSSTASSGSGSDSRHEDCHQSHPHSSRNTFMEEGSGMRDVPLWLKSLRLHKYAMLFQELTYDEMFNLTEDWLEQKNVTKGARHKIILHISKLTERQDTLRKLEKDIADGGSLKNCMTEMKTMLNSPIKAISQDKSNSSSPANLQQLAPGSSSSTGSGRDDIAEGDLPSQFTSLMAKVCSQLLTSAYDDECCNMYIQLLDKCLNHESFSQKQKRLLDTWKQQARKIWQPAPFKYGYDKKTRPNWVNTYPISGTYNSRPIQLQGPRGPPKLGGTQWSFGTKRSLVGGTMSSGHIPLHRNNSLNTAVFSRPGVVEQAPVKQPVTRTQSAPLRSQQLAFGAPAVESSTDTEINARLDSLCWSVAECALGTSDSSERGSAY